jgi:hypothetical protein
MGSTHLNFVIFMEKEEKSPYRNCSGLRARLKGT